MHNVDIGLIKKSAVYVHLCGHKRKRKNGATSICTLTSEGSVINGGFLSLHQRGRVFHVAYHYRPRFTSLHPDLAATASLLEVATTALRCTGNRAERTVQP